MLTSKLTMKVSFFALLKKSSQKSLALSIRNDPPTKTMLTNEMLNIYNTALYRSTRS